MNHWSDSNCVGGYQPDSAHIPLWAWIGAVIFTVVFFGIVPFVGYLAGM